jgi:streptomycin 3"-adenylyltransferase
MEVHEILNKLVNHCCQIFNDNLVGIYLHGSMAMGCFNPIKSDVDLLVIVDHIPTNQQKEKLMDVILELNNEAPAKGIEMSLVLSEYCKNFVYPTPFDLHFSNMHLNWYKTNPKDYIDKMKGTDPDLAAHFVITKQRGIVLYGKAINDVYGEIPSEAYLDSIKSDVAGAKEDVLENPVYIILNLCRVLAYVQDGLVLSKKEGGEWGMSNIDSIYHSLINEALECYASNQDMKLNNTLALEYSTYMLNKIGI